LAGGILNLASPIAGNEVIANQLVLLYGPGSGYNVTVAANNTLGSANTTSQISVLSGAVNTFAAINNLTLNAPVFNVGTTANGLLVAGTTTLTSDSVISNAGTLLLAGKIAGAGYGITKVGAGNLIISNSTPGAQANSLSALNVLQGTTEIRLASGDISNPLGSGTAAITLNGGGILNMRHDGDAMGELQVLTTFANNSLVIGSVQPVPSSTFVPSATVTVSLQSIYGGNNKTVQFGTLRFGGALGGPVLAQNVGNSYNSEFTGGLAMLGRDAALNIASGQLTIDGNFTGNGTLWKQNGELDINTSSTGNTATGGLVLASGNTYFASYQGNVRTLNTTAKTGLGAIVVQPSALLFFSGTSNLNAGQLVEVRSNLANYGVVGLGEDQPLSKYNLRSPFSVGAFATSVGPFSNSLLASAQSGGGVLAINTVYTQSLDLSKIGDGTWFLGSAQNGAGLNGTFNGGTLGVGAAYNGLGTFVNADSALPAYRLGAGGQTLYIGLYPGAAGSVPNQLTGATNLVVGAPLVNGSSSNPGNGTGTVILNSAQNYTGQTLVNRGSILEVRGAMSTSGYEVFGALTIGGLASLGTTPVVLRAGGSLRLDDNFDVLAVGSNRVGAGTLTLDNATLLVKGSAALDTVTNIGTLLAVGGAVIQPNGIHAGRTVTVNLGTLTRATNYAALAAGSLNGIAVSAGPSIAGNNALLSIQPTVTGQLGINERVFVTDGGTSTVRTNGMVPAWLWNATDAQFLTYGEYGFTNAGFNLYSTGTVSISSLGTGVERLQLVSTFALPLAGSLSVYALRADQSITGGTINIASGGLIVGANNPTISGTVNFGTEALIHVQAGTYTQTGTWTAGSVAKDGIGSLRLNAENPSFTGNIALNQGTLVLVGSVASGGTSNTGGSGGTVIMNGYNTSLTLLAGTTSASFTNNIVIPRGNAFVTLNTNNQNNALGVASSGGSLTFGGVSGDQGQTFNVQGGSTLQINGVVDLGPVGNAVFYANNANITLVGRSATYPGAIVQGAGTLVKTGASTLSLGTLNLAPTASNTFTGGILIQAGVLQGVATAPTGGGNAIFSSIGSNAITLVGGQLTMLADSGVAETGKIYTLSNSITLAGNAIVNSGSLRSGVTAGGSIAYSKLTLGSQTLTINSTNSYRTLFNSVNLTGLATFNPASSSDPILLNVTDSGAGLAIIKNGGGLLYFSGAQSQSAGTWINADGSAAFSGGVYVNPSANLRFATTTSQAGIGNIVLNPGGTMQLDALGQINGLAGQQIEVRSTANNLGAVTLASTLDPTTVAGSYFTSASTGLLIIGSSSANTLNLGTFGDGSFQLAGAITYAGSISAGTLNTYRIGGNATTLTLSGTNALSGANRALIGSLASPGNVTLSGSSNSYTGGTTVARSSVLTISTGTTSGVSAVGSGSLDVFGTLAVTGSYGSIVNGGTVTLHPGGTLSLVYVAGSTIDRLLDSSSLSLDGANLLLTGTAGAALSETSGTLTFTRGSRITTTGGTLALTTGGTLSRVGSASLVLLPTALSLGTSASVGQRLFVSSGTVVTNGMLPAYYVNGTDNMFLTYGGSGFTNATGTFTVSNGVLSSVLSGSTLSAGTSIISVTTVPGTLATDISVYALRTNQSINNGVGQFNTLTLSGGTAGGGLLVYGSGVIQSNIKSGTSGQYELPVYVAANSLSTLSGDISAGTLAGGTLLGGGNFVVSSGIIKFGAGTLAISKDQSDAARGVGLGYSNGWVVNEGSLTLGVFGALGNSVASNTVYLNGSAIGASQLNLTVNSPNLYSYTYSSGRIIAVDNAVLNFDPGGNDRIQAINDVEVQSTGGSLLDAQLRVLFTNTRQGSILQAGSLYLSNAGSTTNGAAQINVAYGTNVSESVNAGFSVAALSGSNRLVKWGAGTMYVRGASSSFSGAISIEQGALQIGNAGALGTGAVTVRRGGVLDINTTGYNGAPTYLAGSTERWSADGARGGSVNIGNASLQIANDQTTASASVTMNGGAIEGFLARDSQIARNSATAGAVTRTLGAGVSFVLAGDSFLGQTITGGINGLESGVMPVVGTPYQNQLTGVLLDIKGVISGTYGLTKQGFDTVTLSGANTYSGTTNVASGVLRIGANNSLPVTSALLTRGDAVFDLNGFDQTVGRLLSPVAAISGTLVNGFISNSATTVNTLTAGSGSTGDASYGGLIQRNIALVKTGTSTLTLTGANTYTGGTTINGGWLNLQNGTGSAVGTGSVTVNSGGILAGGGSSSTTIGAIPGLVTLNSGATLQPGAVTGGVSSAGTLSLGALNIAGSSSLVFQLYNTGSSDQIILSGSGSSLTLGGTATFVIQGAAALSGSRMLIKYSTSGATISDTSTIKFSLGNPLLSATIQSDAFGISAVFGAYTGILNWTGAGDSLWDTGTHASPKNWKQATGGSSADFADTANILFDDTATSGTVTLIGTVTPGSMTFTNSTLAYTLGGTGAIAGTASLVKSGTGLLTISAGSSTFSGGGTLSAGSLVLAANSTVVNGTITSGPLGSGAFTLAGAQILDDGTARILANTLSITADTTLASTGTSGAGSLLISNASGASTLLTGALTLTVNTPLTYAQSITGSSSLTLAGTSAIVLSGSVQLGLGALVKSNPADLTLSAANSFSGGFTMSSGTVYAGNNLSFGSGTITYNGGVIAANGTAALSFANDVVFGTDVFLGDTARTGTLTFAGNVSQTAGGTWTVASDVVLNSCVMLLLCVARDC
ncbi:MAG: hypothetical protein EBS01_01850, partial [Verrucomicrobia bacterium]|nr:hypothetical protein [Verrucomicrobiota bacterium]